MNSAQANAAIIKRWLDAWPGASSNVPFSVDNIVKPEASTYAIMEILSLDTQQVTLGRKAKVRHDGIIQIRLVGPVNAGRGALDLLAQAVRVVLQRRRIGANPPHEMGIVTQIAEDAELRRDREAPGSWVLAVSVPFHYHEVVSQG